MSEQMVLDIHQPNESVDLQAINEQLKQEIQKRDKLIVEARRKQKMLSTLVTLLTMLCFAQVIYVSHVSRQLHLAVESINAMDDPSTASRPAFLGPHGIPMILPSLGPGENVHWQVTDYASPAKVGFPLVADPGEKSQSDEADTPLASRLKLEDQKERYQVVLDTRGLDPDSIKLGLVGRTLRITAESSKQSTARNSSGQLREEKEERRFLSAGMTMPGPVIGDQMRARMNGSRLYIMIPKANPPEEQPRSYPPEFYPSRFYQTS